MCGLAGIFHSRSGAALSEELLLAMREKMFHRGPDGGGHYLGEGVGLAHRRLAIVDVTRGHQPLYNETGRVVVVFNGEIYNFQPLMAELIAKGHVFKTHSDTEVIVHGWEEWGPDCVTRFTGMFAFAVWDADKETLFIARDRMGKKPLYYSELSDGRLLFASELKSLVACPDLPRQIDPQAVEDYLAYGYVPDPRSIYRGVYKLPPAHRLVWRRGDKMKIDAYWNLRVSGVPVPADEAEAAAELQKRFRQAVSDRLISEVPLGAFLSGGVDSSGVVALMAGVVQEPVKTFCIAFDERGFDESAYASTIAKRYNTHHTVSRVDPNDLSLIDRLAGMFDEPFGDNSAMPTYQVCALARKHVTVALSGDGGDEVFAGYRRYRWHLHEENLRRKIPAAIRGPLFGTLGALYPKMDWAPRFLRAKTTFLELSYDAVQAFCHSVSVIPEGLRHSLYSDSFRRDLQGYKAIEVLRKHMNDADTDDPVRQAQYADIKTWLPGDILVKVDRTSMATSLEARAPLLDHNIVEWGVNLPTSMKIKGQQGKMVLKKSLEAHVPDDLLYRPKQGFSAPLDVWFRGPLAGRIEQAAGRLEQSGIFAGGRIQELVSQHRSGKRNHGPTLWVLMMLDAFLTHHAGL